jgi:hypothetical protein
LRFSWRRDCPKRTAMTDPELEHELELEALALAE